MKSLNDRPDCTGGQLVRPQHVPDNGEFKVWLGMTWCKHVESNHIITLPLFKYLKRNHMLWNSLNSSCRSMKPFHASKDYISCKLKWKHGNQNHNTDLTHSQCHHSSLADFSTTAPLHHCSRLLSLSRNPGTLLVVNILLWLSSEG